MNKKNFALLLIGAMLTVILGSAFTYDYEDPFAKNREREEKVIEAILNGSEIPDEMEEEIVIDNHITTMWICVECESLIPSTCLADARVADVGTHTYGGGKKCTETLLYSRGAYVCQYCKHVEMIPGEHWCWDVHKDCGKGAVDCCPLDVS